MCVLENSHEIFAGIFLHTMIANLCYYIALHASAFEFVFVSPFSLSFVENRFRKLEYKGNLHFVTNSQASASDLA